MHSAYQYNYDILRRRTQFIEESVLFNDYSGGLLGGVSRTQAFGSFALRLGFPRR